MPQCSIERNLRNKGLCLSEGRFSGYKICRPNVKVSSIVYEENNRLMVRTDYETPIGKLNIIKEVGDFTFWVHKKMFTDKEDYKILDFLINDAIIQPDYENVLKALKFLGEDVFLHGSIGYEPMQNLISGNFFGLEKFCIEWMDNRDEILKLYKSLVRMNRKIYKVLAESPFFLIFYGGNLIPEITSPHDFEKYYIPNYEEAAEILHKKGKLLGCHYDSNLKLHKELIGSTSLDVITAFTPYPDTEVTMTEARKIFKDKILWINFPSSVHLYSRDKIAETTDKIIDDAGPQGLIIGITEHVPENKWQQNYMTIMDTIDRKFNIKY